VRWAGRGNLRKKRNAYGFVVGKPEGTNHLEDVYVDIKIMLKTEDDGV
jgi:hypothetical protein